MPSYDELYAARYGKPVSPESRSLEVTVWNALLDAAIEAVARSKDEFVRAADFHSAAVARDLAETLRVMKDQAAPGKANGHH